MKVTVINGNNRHGSTWHSMDAIMQALSRCGDVETTEFFLPKDMPHFCRGCFSCFIGGEATCPHAQSVQPIAAALLEADLIVLGVAHDRFKNLDPAEVRQLTKADLVYDGVNAWEKAAWEAAGFKFFGLARKY